MTEAINDMTGVIEADRAHIWHHLIQHKQFETIDPRIIVEGKGMRVWDAKGKEYIDARVGRGLDGQRRLRPRVALPMRCVSSWSR